MDIVAFPVAAFMVGQVALPVEAAKNHLTGNIGYAVPLGHYAEVLPVETHGEVIGVLWDGRVGIGNIISGIDDTVAVIVDNMEIPGQLLIVIVIVHGTRIQLIPAVVVARTHVGISLADLLIVQLLIVGQ